MKQVGRYQIGEKIGEGAMADVYKAHDPQIDRPVVFKMLKRERRVDEEYVSRFLREAKAAGALSHPNIVTVYDVGEVDDHPYIMMEYLDGTPLDVSLKSEARFSLSQAISISIQLADALDYAHRNGVVHRDVKPSNIIILPDSQTVKITDFGIAHVDDTDATQHTQAGMMLGTPQYMSPEQALGQKVDGRSDLFSVGVILYELLTGKKPFTGRSMATLLLQITQEQPPPISQISSDVPAGLQHIVDKLLSKQPERRFETGGDLSRALTRELRATEEAEEEKGRHRYVPIRLKWTLLMAAIVALTMVAGTTVIYQKLIETVTGQVIESGESLAKFIATESAVPILGEDWVSIEIFVQEASRRQDFAHLTIVDHKGIVRGAMDPEQISMPFVGPDNVTVISQSDDLRASVVERADGTAVFDIDTPVKFQDKSVGMVHLGLSQAPLRSVADTTLVLMVALALVTVASVSVVSYVLARLLSRPLKTLRESMGQVAEHNFDCRISQTRNDELGELFATFNRMVASLSPAGGEAGAGDDVAAADIAAEPPEKSD